MTTSPASLESRYLGVLFGLACGDAVGTTLEFSRPGSFEPVTDMTGGGPFELQPGEWTDDTSMALCLAASLVERGGFDAVDQMNRYVRWRDAGYMASNGRCFDIGGTVSSALQRFARSGEAFAGSTQPDTAGNGSLMRLGPIAMAFAADPVVAITRAAEMSRTTHGAPEAVDACRYFCGLIVGALNGADKAELLQGIFAPAPDIWRQGPLTDAIEEIARGSFLEREPPQIRGSGYVVESLEAALWAFSRGDDFQSSVLLAANLGDDADTTAAICGQLAGAYYGLAGIPAHWRARLAKAPTIEKLGVGLHALSAASN